MIERMLISLVALYNLLMLWQAGCGQHLAVKNKVVQSSWHA